MEENSSSGAPVLRGSPRPEGQSFAEKHTPGPYNLGSSEDISVSFDTPHGGAWFTIMAPGRTCPVALVPEFYDRDLAATGDGRPNANLFLAAPDLLEALKAAERLVNEALPKFDWGRSNLDANAIQLLNEAPTAIRAAIAKAEGRGQ